MTLSTPLTSDPETGFIGNRLFLDENGNGILDNNESGIGRGFVTLIGAGADNIFGTSDDLRQRQTIASKDGFYGFSNLSAGQYRLRFSLPDSRFTFTAANAGPNESADSDVDPATGATASFTLAPGEFRGNIDAGLVERVSPSSGDPGGTGFIGNRVFWDRSPNFNIFDGFDEGVGDVRVILSGAGQDELFGTSDDIFRTQVTGREGFYGFDNLAAGLYSVTFEPASGGFFSFVEPNVGDDQPFGEIFDSDVIAPEGRTATIRLGEGERNANIDAGLRRPTAVDPKSGFIGNRVFFDENRNGILDGNEGGIRGARVTLTAAGRDGKFGTRDDRVRRQAVGDSGFYGFSNLAAERYKLTFDNLPQGTAFTAANAGTNDKLDSDVNPTTGMTDVINLSENESITNVDAGLVQQGPLEPQKGFIGNRIFIDENKNGVFDANEFIGPRNVRARLTGAGQDGQFGTADDINRTQRVDGLGFYGFDQLEAGQYRIAVEDLPADLAFAAQDVGSDDTRDSDIDANTGITEVINLADGSFRNDIDAGLVRQEPPNPGESSSSFIGNRVFLDENFNGLFDSNESGIGGARVTLIAPGADGDFGTADDIRRSQTVGPDGFYGFDNLADGSYQISVDNLPNGLIFSPQTIRSDDGRFDSDVDPNTGLAEVFVARDRFNDDVDIGLAPDTQAVTLVYSFESEPTSPDDPTPRFLPQLKLETNNGALIRQPDFFTLKFLSRVLDTSVERVEAPAGRGNSINFSYISFGTRTTPASFVRIAPAIDLNLETQQLQYGDTVTPLIVENFVNVLGSLNGDRIQGDAQDNELNGFAGQDVLVGGAGNDILVANEEDILTGGAGADQFKFLGYLRTTSDRGGVSVREIRPNTVTDFEIGRDRLVFENSEQTLGSLYSSAAESTRVYEEFSDLASGALPSEQFAILGSSPAPESAKFIYDGATGELFYRSGQSPLGASQNIQIATLQGAPQISASDFLVV